MVTTYQKTDAEIEKQILDELCWDCRTEGSAVSVEVESGTVTLSGKVKTYAVKCAAEEATHRIAGVQAANNAIVVKIPYLEFKADKEILEAVTHTFFWNVLIPHEQVSAEIAEGWITVYGAVDCWSQREETERAIGLLAGVRGITNHIRVNAPQVEAQRVCEAIEATLERQSLQEAIQVHVEMQDGMVRLSGQVPTWGERNMMLSAIGSAPGVRQIQDDLTLSTRG